MRWLGRAWDWVRGRWQWLLLVVTVVFGAIAARRILRTLRDEAALKEAKRRVDELRRDRAELERDGERNAASLKRLDEHIHEQRVRAVRAYEEGQGLEGRALEKAFEELGF